MGEREEVQNNNDIEIGVERRGPSSSSSSRSASPESRRITSSSLKEPLLLPHDAKRTNQTSQLAIIGANVCPIESLDYEYYSTLSYQPHFLYIYIYIHTHTHVEIDISPYVAFTFT